MHNFKNIFNIRLWGFYADGKISLHSQNQSDKQHMQVTQKQINYSGKPVWFKNSLQFIYKVDGTEEDENQELTLWTD